MISINLNPSIPALPRIEDKTKINIRYSLISPYATAHIFWDSKISELVYEIEEPYLQSYEKDALDKLERAMLELININVAVEKTTDSMIQYINKTARLLIDELNIKITEDTYNKLFYYLFRDFIGMNEIDPILRDYFIEDIECNGIDTPVYIIHRIYRNMRTNLKFTDIDKLASFVEKLAQRAGRYVSYAQPLLDGSLPDGSLDYEEPVIYKENGIIKVSKIGKVIDKFYKNKESNEPVYIDNIEVPAFDKDYKISWKKADYVYRHKIKEDLYELKTEFGKKVKLTGCHSIFKLTNEGLKNARTDELKVGDYIAFPLKIPENDIIKEINLAEELSKTEQAPKLIIENIPEKIYETNKQIIFEYYNKNYKIPNQAYYEHKNKRILPIGLYHLLSREELEKTKIRTTSAVGVKSILKIDKSLMRFLGLYIAEGWITHTGNHHRIEFCLSKDETNLIEDLLKSMKESFGIEGYLGPVQNNARKIIINSYVLEAVLEKVLNISKGAKNKEVPEIVFNVNKELQQEFIRAWQDGDCGSTVSSKLKDDISYLGLFSGQTIAFQDRERICHIEKRVAKSHEFYTNFFRREVSNSYSNMIPIEVFNPLNQSHMNLSNKRINRDRLKEILGETRYQRLNNLNMQVPIQFKLEWGKRGFIDNDKITKKGSALLNEIDIVRKLIDSDLGFAKIKSIEKVKPSCEFVYDFSVKDCENFIGGVGGLCCHNTRINATFTKDVTSRGPSFTLRKFTKVPWTPTQLIALNTLSPEMLAYFWMLLQYKANILISGGTASGKTTLLNALAFFIPPEARVVSIEDTKELNLPRENWLPAIARTSIGIGKLGEVDLFALLKNSFRQNPDYVVVGEVRGKEAFVLFQGMASGHPSLSTVHSDSVDTLIRRLQTPPIELSPTLVNTLDCVAIMTHALVGKRETRRLREIVEIVHVNKDGTALVNTPFIWDPRQDMFYFKKQSKVFEKISARYGISEEKLQKEFITRTKLLYALYLKRVFGFDEIEKVINNYYKNPAEVLNQYGISE